MKMKNGTASSTWLLMTPNRRSGNSSTQAGRKKQKWMPRPLKRTAVPPSAKATG